MTAWKFNKTVGGVLALFAFIYATVVTSVVTSSHLGLHRYNAKYMLTLLRAPDCAVAELFCTGRGQLAGADFQHRSRSGMFFGMRAC